MPTSKTAKAPETTPAKGDKKLSTFLCFAIYSANLAFGRAYKPLLDKLGLTYTQYVTLVALSEEDGQTVSMLGEKLFLESNTLTPLLKRMPAKPVLMIAGARDTYVGPEITAALCRQLGENCREFWVVPGARHNMARQVDAVTYDRKLIELFSSVAAGTAGQRVVEEQPQA